MPLSVHYTPKMWIIRHKILCPGSIKMCMVITKHILVVKQLGNEGKKKGRKHRVLLYPLLVLMSFPTYAIEVPTCYWTWMGALFACIECLSKPSMFQLSTTLFFGICACIFDMCACVLEIVFFLKCWIHIS